VSEETRFLDIFHLQLRKTKKVDIESKASLSLEAIFKHYFPNKTYQGKFTYGKNKIKKQNTNEQKKNILLC